MYLLIGLSAYCAICGSRFGKTHNRQRYCGPQCRKDAEAALRRRLKRLNCNYEPCSALFDQTHGLQLYCSRACRNAKDVAAHRAKEHAKKHEKQAPDASSGMGRSRSDPFSSESAGPLPA